VIGYYAHHHGAGHLTRMQSIATAMEESVWGLSSSPAPTGWDSGWTRLARDDGPDVAQLSRDCDPTAHGVLHWAPRGHDGLARRSAQVTAWAARERPRALVVDVSVEVALLARLCGVPTVVVAMPGRRHDRAHRLAYDTADALLAPWPRGAHDHDWPQEWTDKTCFVGGMSRFDHLDPGSTATTRAPGQGGTVLVLWGAGGRTTTAAELEAARAATPSWTWVERAPGTPSTRPLWEDLQRADVVVTHAGQNAVAEVAAARRPAVVVAQPRPFDEQVATARRVDTWGIAVGRATWPSGEEWPATLELALLRGGDGWKRWSTGHAAQDAAAHLLGVGLPPGGRS
jgi:hypothetical protein